MANLGPNVTQWKTLHKEVHNQHLPAIPYSTNQEERIGFIEAKDVLFLLASLTSLFMFKTLPVM